MSKLNGMDWLTHILLIIGGLNWLLVGLFDFDVVAAIFGDMSVVSIIVYVLVGLSALYVLFTMGKMGKKMGSSMQGQ